MSDDLQEPEARPRDLDEVRERLKARGLLTDAPAVVIPKEPRRVVEPSEAPPAAGEDEEPHWGETPYDSWDVEPGPETAQVSCPRCRTVCTVPVEATRVACVPCETNWRYAVCDQCGLLDLTMERQESWRCHRCGTFRRSWWRTPSARMLAIPIIVKRREVLAREQGQRVREGMRLRRWKLIAFAVCASLATAIFVVLSRSSEPSTASGRKVACPHFRQILEDVSSGHLTPADLDTQLEELQTESDGEGPEFANAIAGMRAAESPTSPGFITSRAALVDACGPDLGT